MSSAVVSRRELLMLALAVRLNASDSDFWNKKAPANWTPEEIERLLSASPWAREVTPTYTSLPPPTDKRPWGETPPIGRGPWSPPASGPIPRRQTSPKAPYQAIIRWESAEPIRRAQKTALPAAFGDQHVVGVYFRD